MSWSYCHPTFTSLTEPRFREKDKTKLVRVPWVSRRLSLQHSKETRVVIRTRYPDLQIQ
jgi:hypothetical protein